MRLTRPQTLHMPYPMANILGVIYGIHIVLIIYLITFISVKGMMQGKRGSIVLLLGKYMIYGALILFGFKRLPAWAILSGFIGGIYFSLPILYYINKKWVDSSEQKEEKLP